MDNCITGQAAYWKSNGHWNISLAAPEWVIADIKKELAAKGGIITVGSYSGAGMVLIAASWEVRHPTPEASKLLATTRTQPCKWDNAATCMKAFLIDVCPDNCPGRE